MLSFFIFICELHLHLNRFAFILMHVQSAKKSIQSRFQANCNNDSFLDRSIINYALVHVYEYILKPRFLFK